LGWRRRSRAVGRLGSAVLAGRLAVGRLSKASAQAMRMALGVGDGDRSSGRDGQDAGEQQRERKRGGNEDR
jgi:hypothetical protein